MCYKTLFERIKAVCAWNSLREFCNNYLEMINNWCKSNENGYQHSLIKPYAM